MVKKGDTIYNPVTTERIVFTETSADTSGRYLSYDYFVGPNHPISPKHIHPCAIEEFEVISGELSVDMAGSVKKVTTGEKIAVYNNVPHTGWNSGTGELHLKSKITPAMAFENYYKICFEQAEKGKVKKNGMPGLLQLAVLGNSMKDQFYLPKFVALQKIFFFIMGPIGKIFGYKSS